MTFFRSYCPNYYSIEDIMATQETITCRAESPINKYGFLVPGNDKEDIEPNTELEIPLWLASSMLASRSRRRNYRAIVSIQIPKAYNERSRDIFDADAKVVNLHRVNQHFYEFGRMLSCLNNRESELVKSLIIKVFKERFRLILDWADNVITQGEKIQMLDMTERRLLRLGHDSRTLLDTWLVAGVSNMQPAKLVLNLRKRKLITES